MELSRINVNLLVALDHLLTHQSVQLAAEKQYVSASAMSHSLRTLRGIFGDELLTRTQGGMVRTPLAEQLMGPLHRALRNLERAVTDVAEFDPQPIGTRICNCCARFHKHVRVAAGPEDT